MKNMNIVSPIKDPQRIYPGQVLFTITVSKMTKQTNFESAIVGSNIQFAAIQEIKVKSLELNEGETGVIINKNAENIRIAFDVASLRSDGDGSVFDDEKKALAVAKIINSNNITKIEALEEELNNAKAFLKQLVSKGA